MADPYKNNVVLYLPMEGSRDGDTIILDKTGKTLSVNAGATLSNTVLPPFGTTSAKCISGGHISMTYNTDFNWWGTPYCIEAWVYLVNMTGLYDSPPTLFAHAELEGGNYRWGFGPNTSGYLTLYGWNGSTYSATATSNPLSAGYWYHIAMTQVEGVIKFYVNGVYSGGATLSNSGGYMSNYPFAIARMMATSPNCYVKDLRITRGVVRYSGNFSTHQITTVDDADWANVVLAIHGEGTGTTFTDVSNSANTITTNGNTTHSTAVTPPFGTSSIYFDANGDYLSIPTSSNFAFGTGDFTVEFWLRSSGTGQQHLYEGRNGTTTNTILIYLNSSTQLTYYANGGNTITTTSVPTLNTWVHIAVCRFGTFTKMFLDGTQVGSTYSDSINYAAPTTSLYIGTNDAASGSWLYGYIKDFRVTKGVARYTQNFTPKYAPFPDKTAIKTIAKPLDWDNPEPPRIML